MELEGLQQPSSAALRSHIQAVRLFMRDWAELNVLTRGQESSDRMILWCTLDFLSDFNGTPPLTRYSLEHLYSLQLQSLAIRGTIIGLLQSVGILQTRNHLPFSDGGISVSINDKAPQIQSWLQLFQSSYEQKKRLVKTALNVEQLLDDAPGGLHSDYYALSSLGLY